MKWISRILSTAEMSWRITSTLIIVGAVLGLLLFAQLDSLLPGYAPQEVATAKQSQSLRVIVDNPVNAPFKVISYGIAQLTDDILLSLRITAAIFGSLTALLFYLGVRHWHSGRVSFLATLLFGTSAWFLHTARLGTADIMFPFSILLLAVAGYWVVNSRRSGFSYIAILLALSASLFVPGIVWFVIGALAVRRGKDIRAIIQHFSLPQIIGFLVLLVFIVLGPIVAAIINQPLLALDFMGLPSSYPPALDVLQQLALVPFSLFIATGTDPAVWLGSLPYLDIFTSVMFFLGVYYYYKYRALDRAKFLLIFIVVSALLISLGAVSESILIPAIYIAAAGGIALLLSQWMTIFPKNPLAQNVAITLIAVAVGVSTIYNLRAYFIAWPQAPDTRAAYQLTDKNLLQ